MYINETVLLTMEDLKEIALCISESDLNPNDALEYVENFAQDFIESPL
jgi:hypothetical protein